MLNLDRFLSCPLRVLRCRAGNPGLARIPCAGVCELVEILGETAVSPVEGDGRGRESSDMVVAAEGDMFRPVFSLSPAVSQREGCCTEVVATGRWSTGLAA